MKIVKIKKLIAVIFTMSALITSVNFAYAESETATNEEIKPEMKIVYPVTSEKYDTHVANTPQFDDELKAEVTYDKEKIKEEPVVTWFRFNNKPKYNEQGEKIADTYYEEIATGTTYRITPEDIHHVIKVETTVDGTHLVIETEPVEKKNYGKVRLQVVDNTNYGDTDGYVGLLDTRMQYTCDDVTICDVTTDGAILNSGTTLDTLNPNGFTWKVRYKGTTLVEESEWETFTIKAGKKNPLESFELNLISRTLTPDEPDYQLKTTITPENAYVGSVKYKSSDTAVATVSEDGVISAVNNGEATITVTVTGVDNEFTQECNIEVKNFEIINEAIVVEDNISLELKDDEKFQLSSAIYPETATEYTESWRSSDESICTVDDKGIVSCVNAGNAMVIYTVSQGEKQVMDTVNVEVLPIPSVSCPNEWKRGSGEDLTFEFVGCTPNENTVVIAEDNDGKHEIVSNYYYTIDSNKLTVKYDYLMSFSVGDASISFDFPVVEEEPVEECVDNQVELQDNNENNIAQTEESEVPVPVITSASSNLDGKTKRFSLLSAISNLGQKLFSNGDNTTTTHSSTILGATFTVVPENQETITLKPGNTFKTCIFELSGSTLGEGETFDVEVSSTFNNYFAIEDKQLLTKTVDSKTYVYGIKYIVSSLGNNTPTDTTETVNIVKINSSGVKTTVEYTYYVKGSDFYTSLSLSISNSAEIKSDSQSKCTIEPTLSGATLDDNFLKAYDITFYEVDGPNSSQAYSGFANYFVQSSLVLNENKVCVAVGNREGTGYIRGLIKLKMIEESTGNTRTSLTIGESKNNCTVKIVLYTDITKKNIQHLWSQNSTVNLTYTIQGDFNKFLTDNGGKFTDENVYVWYKKGTTYNRLKISLNHFTIEQVGDNVANLTINYNFLRRLHLGSYPIYIVFKYDGSNIYRSYWSERGNYILSTFTVIKAGTPITGDTYDSAMWFALIGVTVPVTCILGYTLLKKKKTVVKGSHQK